MQDGSPINPPQPPPPPPPLSADVGEQRVKKMEDDEPLRTPRAPAPVKAAHRSLKEHLTVSSLRWHLLAISFGTGLLDAATYSDLGIFASNQTGNTIILLVEAINSTTKQAPSERRATAAPLRSVGVSLASFLVFGLLFGQAGVSSRFVGPRTRGWLTFSTFVQAALLLLAAALVQAGILKADYAHRNDGASNTIIVFLLAASAGIQVAMAKSVDVKEIPTAMLTSPYVDTLIDKNLFALRLKGEDVASRNVRLGYFAFFASGTVTGAAARAYAGSASVLWIAFALRMANLVYVLVAPGHPQQRHRGGEENEDGDEGHDGGDPEEDHHGAVEPLDTREQHVAATI